jgi:hypothetical protein
MRVAMDWYVARDGETFGPFPFEVLVKGVSDGELTPQDFVWSESMVDWQPASTVPGLFSPPGLPSSAAALTPPLHEVPHQTTNAVTASGIPHVANVAGASAVSTGLIRRHWRGELPLPLSYWGVAISVMLGTVGLQHVFATALEIIGNGTAQFALALAGFLAFLCMCATWQLLGVWRFAARYLRSGRPKVWAVLARLIAVACIVVTSVDFGATVGPLILTRFAPNRKEAAAARQLRLLRNGTEIELAGSITEGTADALKQLLDAAPRVQVVHLNSNGGNVAEGYEIYQLIRDRKLITYTATNCVSACTIAFLGGTKRLLSTRARLGFHSVSISGIDQRQIPAINTEVRRTLLSHGAPEWFVTKAVTTNSDSMWYPTKSELTAAKIVTGVVDPDQFGLSGVAIWRDQEAIERELLTLPLYALVRDNDPDMFKKIAGRFAEGVKEGKSLIEITQDAQSVFTSDVIPKYIMSAPAEAIRRYWETQVQEITHLRDTDPVSCIAFLFPQLRSNTYKLADLLPEQLLQADVGALTFLVKEAIEKPTTAAEMNVDADLDMIGERLAKRIPDVLQLISEPLKYTEEPKRLCSAFVAFSSEIMALPPEKSAAMVRWLVDQGR